MSFLTTLDEPMTRLFPARLPETTEAMTPAESEALAAWQESPSGRGLYAAMARHIAERLDLTEGRLLSVAEGEGLLAHRLAEVLPGVDVLGTDVCDVAVGRAERKHVARNLTYQAASVYDLGVLGSFDAVVCMFSFHHFHDPALALEQMIGALRPGGRLYIMDLRRDAAGGPYFRWLDTYVSIALPVAPLFRASVQAAHTREEVRALLAPFDGHAEVGQLLWGHAARAAYAGQDPAGLEAFLADARGLYLEALFQRGVA